MTKARFIRVIVSKLLVFSIILVTALMHALFVAQAQGETNQLVLQTWGGRVLEGQKMAYYEPFEKKYPGIKIISVSAAGDMWGKIVAQFRAGHIEWDTTGGTSYYQFIDAANKGFIQEIDYSKIWDQAGVSPSDYLPEAIQKYAIGDSVNIFTLCWNTKKYSGDNHPKSWADFYDVKKFPGPRAIPDWGSEDIVFFSALLADGVSPDKLVPIDFDRAIRVMDRIKPHIKLAYKSGDQFMQAMADQEVTIVLGTDCRCGSARELGAPIAFTWNQGLALLGFFGILKGAPNLDNVYKYVRIMVRPENQVKYAVHLNMPTSNTKYVNYLPEHLRSQQGLHPNNRKHLLWPQGPENIGWLADHKKEISERFQTWLTR